ncbi:glycosyl hydrolase family 8 [Paenisporosarcina sp.]|uniref:glycosyl hydrolase family 8 n=1 Tax=Paenisporosarcina sp. TaxID=1932001 RepID=UPI003C735EC4
MIYIYIPLLLLTSSCTNFLSEPHKEQPSLPTEKFIQKYLIEEDGRIQTNITALKEEYLSESLGLWMQYLVVKDDRKQFDQQVETLGKYFLTKDYFVTWKLYGDKKAPANAFIDDLRIVESLYHAGEKWNHTPYTKMADKMSNKLVNYQTHNSLMVDFVELASKNKGSEVTLSYIIPAGFELMRQAEILPIKTYESTKKVLLDAPHSELGFYPKRYDVPKGTYTYAQEVNLIDQFYVGYHRAQWQGDVEPLVAFAKQAFAESGGKLYGRYDGRTGKPVVAYEAASVYALAILMCLEVEEKDFAKDLYAQMKTLQQSDEKSPYYGGYIDTETKETHSFDNLLALLAERRVLDETDF